ncbi:MAG: hypothetical protein IPN54_03870 [Bacteroidetes bacterium]|nr:hypothetical protein [Bacteroidota bacterium]
MQNKKETSDKLDQLLKTSANDTPVMSIDDVQQLLKNAPAPVKGKTPGCGLYGPYCFYL